MTLLCGVTLTYHLVQYERGREKAATGFAATLSGIFYIGLLGSYLVLLRNLPAAGEWWLLLTLFAVMLADTTAYFFGMRYGQHRLAPRLSPHKSWEGYFAGIVGAAVGTPLFWMLFRFFGLPSQSTFSFFNTALLGLMVGIFPILGDLGISMIKREMNIKDTSHIIPGHGGVLDRIDFMAVGFPHWLLSGFFRFSN